MPENHSLILDKKYVLKSPAPWRLKGVGILLVYKLKREWVETYGNLPKHLKGKFKGGLGMLLLANYSESPVGPFHEILFIPGKFRKSRKQAVTRSFSDKEVSTQNLRSNWGIPTENVEIAWDTTPNQDRIRLAKNGDIFFSADFESGGLSFPLSTAFLPLRLCQTWNKLKYFTRLSGSGWGKLVKIKQLDLNPDLFPDIRGIHPLFAIKVNPFFIRFPKPTYREEHV